MPNLSNTVTFVFAGDGSLASDGLSVFLQTKSNFLMVAECNTGASAIDEIAGQRPEIAVMDAQLPDMGARQIIAGVRARNQETKIIVLGGSASRDFADQLVAAGADAYVVRNGPSRYLTDAIRYVRHGDKYLAPQLTKELPVSAEDQSSAEHRETVLRNAIEAQSRTVERLEQAMGRAQQAIELLQQKVEQLSSASVEANSPSAAHEKPGRGGILLGLRTGLGPIAAAVVMGILGFVLAGVLKPPVVPPSAEFSSMGTEDALKIGSAGSLHLSGWETESMEKASALLRNQQYAAAEQLSRNLLKQNPANVLVSRVLASALFHQNKVEESADVLRSMAVPASPVVHPSAPKITFEN